MAIKKNSDILISTIVTIFLISIIIFFIVWINLSSSNPYDSLKDALNFTASIFSGLTTLGASIVATYLFNDWRVERKYLNLKDNVDEIKIIIEKLNSDLDLFKKDFFNDIETFNYNFYKLYELIQTINIKNTKIDEFKEKHLKVASILGKVWLENKNILGYEERFQIMSYRGLIWELKTILADHLNEVLNNS